MTMPGMPAPPAGAQLPPGVQLPPGIHMQSNGNGMTMTSTNCITSDYAVPNMPKNPSCAMDKMEQHGGSVKWAVTCKVRNGEMHSNGAATYHGETMAGDVTTVTSMNSAMMGGAPMNMNMVLHITGKYVGPCDRPAQ